MKEYITRRVSQNLIRLFLSSILVLAIALPVQAAPFQISETEVFDFVPTNSVALNTQLLPENAGGTRHFVANGGGINIPLTFNLANPSVGTLIGVDLVLNSTAFPLLDTEAVGGATLAATLNSSLSGAFSVNSSISFFDLRSPFSLAAGCTAAAGQTCNADDGSPLAFDGSASALLADLGDFLGTNTFDIELFIDGPELSTTLMGEGRGFARGPTTWNGSLELIYTFEMRTPPPSDVPITGTLFLFGLGLFMLSFFRIRPQFRNITV